MATHTLSADTLISALTLAPGDTIQLAGYNLIVDMDAVATPVSIANSGGDALLRFIDVSKDPNPLTNGWPRIKLNATLPSNVHPDSDNLPVSDDAHAIDGDGCRTTLTGNARAEIQIDGEFPLGGGEANFPTETREGYFWAYSTSWPSPTSCVLSRPMPVHAGDLVVVGMSNEHTIQKVQVSSVDGNVLTFASAPATRIDGGVVSLMAGGIFIVWSSVPAIGLNQNTSAGTLNLYCPNMDFLVQKNTAITQNVSAKRLAVSISGSAFSSRCILLGETASVVAESCLCGVVALNCGSMDGSQYYSSAKFGDLVCWNLIGYEMQSASYKANCANINVLREGVAASKDSWISPNCNTNGINIRLKNFVFQKSLSLGLKTGVLNLPYLFLYGGTALLQNDNSWFHAPATSDDTTWRYDDRTIKAHSTLRIRALWKRAENSAATAAVAITDPANWYAGTKGGALAETVFPSSANDAWQESRIEWRNDSDEDAQVRVWECVSGDTAGGYLRTIEATGGPM